MYLYIRIDAWILRRKNENRTRRRKTMRAWPRPPPAVKRDEQGGARRTSTTPNGGPHLELWRLRLKTWSKSDFSSAKTTWPTYLHILIYIIYIHLRAGSSRPPQISLATNVACNSNSNITFGIMLTALNSGRGWHSQFFGGGPRTIASAENVFRPITCLQRGK